MSSFLGKIKDIIGGGQFDDLYYEDEMTSDFQPIDNRLNSMSGEPAELVPTSTNQSGIVVSEQSSEKVESILVMKRFVNKLHYAKSRTSFRCDG